MRVVGRPAERLRVGRIGEAHGDAHGGQRVGEQVPGAAVEIGRAHDVVAGPAQVLDRQRRGRLPGADGQRRHAALERGHLLLQRIAGRVHDARIDVAEVLEREQVRRVLGAAELVGRGLEDRHRHGARGDIAARAGMQHHGLGIVALHGHRLSPSWLGLLMNCCDLIRLLAARWTTSSSQPSWSGISPAARTRHPRGSR